MPQSAQSDAAASTATLANKQSASLARQHGQGRVDYRDGRGMNPVRMRRYAAHDWRSDATNLLILSPTGGGKTYLACALAIGACQSKHSVLYFRMDDLARNTGGGSGAEPGPLSPRQNRATRRLYYRYLQALLAMCRENTRQVVERRTCSAATSKSAAGQMRTMLFSASMSRCCTTRRAYHLRSAGTTYQGAAAVDVRSKTIWKAS